MPRDRQGDFSEYQEEEDKKSGAALGAKRRFDEFDCPTCSANNPMGDGYGNNDEVFCAYCGMSFKALVDEEGALRLKEL
jgi:transcription elongation factor Elf1